MPYGAYTGLGRLAICRARLYHTPSTLYCLLWHGKCIVPEWPVPLKVFSAETHLYCSGTRGINSLLVQAHGVLKDERIVGHPQRRQVQSFTRIAIYTFGPTTKSLIYQ